MQAQTQFALYCAQRIAAQALIIHCIIHFFRFAMHQNFRIGIMTFPTSFLGFKTFSVLSLRLHRVYARLILSACGWTSHIRPRTASTEHRTRRTAQVSAKTQAQKVYSRLAMKRIASLKDLRCSRGRLPESSWRFGSKYLCEKE